MLHPFTACSQDKSVPDGDESNGKMLELPTHPIPFPNIPITATVTTENPVMPYPYPRHACHPKQNRKGRTTTTVFPNQNGGAKW